MIMLILGTVWYNARNEKNESYIQIVEETYEWEKRLYVPTMIQKIDDIYYIVDCWNHRVIYSDDLSKPFEEWILLTDDSYIGGHSIASDGNILVIDNTDNSQIIAYKKNNDGSHDKINTIGEISGRPHYVIYDDKYDEFYVISSLGAKIYVFKNIGDNLKLIKTCNLEEIQNTYVRSISIIDGMLYTVSGGGRIHEYLISEEEFILNNVYSVPASMYGMNQISKIGEEYYITINTDDNSDVNKADIIRTKDLSKLSLGEYESIYMEMGFKGQPYFITEFDEKFWITQISASGCNGIKSFRINDNKHLEVEAVFEYDDVIQESIDRYNSRYAIKEFSEEKEVVDLFIFCGQSNMSGKGNANLAPVVQKGYEYRAITGVNNIYNIYEPFGINQNKSNGVNDIWNDTKELRKLGGMVSSFANSYYATTGVPIVGVSCSEGATTISQWMPGTDKYNDIVERCNSAKGYLNASEHFELRHVFMVWCQGESDGDCGTTYETYYNSLETIIDSLVEDEIIDECFIITVGNKKSSEYLYADIRTAQKDLAQNNNNCRIISDLAQNFVALGCMKDEYHYTQWGYNLLGYDAGTNVGNYINEIK